jgi:hypothetical protein
VLYPVQWTESVGSADAGETAPRRGARDRLAGVIRLRFGRP